MTEPRSRWRHAARLAVIALAVNMVMRAASYFGPAAPDEVPPGLVPLHSLFPLPVWAMACLLIAALLLASVWFPRLWGGSLVAYCALQGAWVGSVVFASLFGDEPRAWVSAGNYLPLMLVGLALIIVGAPARIGAPRV